MRLGIVMLFAGCAWGQTRPSVETLIDNMTFLDDSVVVDKAEYLPGEEMRIIVAVKNPTTRALTIPSVFGSDTSFLYCTQWIAGSGPGLPRITVPPGFGEVTDQTLVETLAPSEEKVLRLLAPNGGLFPDPASESSGNKCTLSSRPGQYAAVYRYRGSHARFSVVDATLEAITEARCSRDVLWAGDEGDPPKPLPWYRRVFSLRKDNTSYLAVQRSGRTSYRRSHKDADLLGPVNLIAGTILAPYKIVATSAAAITGIQATMDSSNNLTIIYTDANGVQQRLDLNEDLHPR